VRTTDCERAIQSEDYRAFVRTKKMSSKEKFEVDVEVRDSDHVVPVVSDNLKAAGESDMLFTNIDL